MFFYKKNVMPYGLILFIGLIFTPASFAQSTVTFKELGKQQEYPIYPKPNYGSPEQKKLIKRGEYLAKAGDCISCHTDTKAKQPAYAGGLGIETPFGTFYSPNITPDKETGIGKWTDEQFIRAMRKGVAPNGSNYFPVFPYPYFSKLSRDDVLAIKAYLFSLPPVHQQNLKHDVSWPFSVRFFQYGWKLLFFWPDDKVYQYNSEKPREWNRGGYLVLGLGHCGMCHSPHNLLGGESKKYAFTGNFVNGYYAPNITSASLGAVSTEEIMNVFTSGKMLHGGPVQGPMAEVNHNSLMYLTDDDLGSIAVYLQTVKSEQPAKKVSTATVTAEGGKKIYEEKCTICHATGAAGAPILGNISDWTGRIKQGMPMLIQHALQGFGSMPPKGTCMDCSDNEIKAAVEYLVEASKTGVAVPSVPKSSGIVRLTLAEGKKIYDSTCSVCHAEGKLGSPKVGDKRVWDPLIDQNMDVLFDHSIKGYRRMPPKGTCVTCTNAEVIAAVKYMVEQSKTGNEYNYTLW